ncbi:hypothetical protein FEM33_14820 [Dyadobacter flavalbus]|uniref:Uncharacterized protein n=1 Tax=Dyadobacter flavalbus TaxID=2579942 RepID=A0A5M8QX34_9BACT|nr:hypothetical protein [Dyadobacter flavalbus]KAA6438973.1 hypothetical protein FEM33_14820 [Dyadobacter flavalbus]
MQNEKLFDKIRQTAERSSAASEDWNAEKIWAKVEQRRQKHPLSIWRPYAAASAVLILGFLAWSAVYKQENAAAVSDGNNVKTHSGKAQPVRNQALLQSNAAGHQKYTVRSGERNKTYRKALHQAHNRNADEMIKEAYDALNLPETDSVQVLAAAGMQEEKPVLETAFAEQPHDTLTPLLQMFEHAKRVREERKMIVRLEEKNRSMDLLFFDHPAFMEHHPGSEPKLFLQKR